MLYGAVLQFWTRINNKINATWRKTLFRQEGFSKHSWDYCLQLKPFFSSTVKQRNRATPEEMRTNCFLFLGQEETKSALYAFCFPLFLLTIGTTDKKWQSRAAEWHLLLLVHKRSHHYFENRNWANRKWTIERKKNSEQNLGRGFLL